jgi:hypothetical protein
MRIYRLAGWGALAAGLALLSGCGGGGSPTTATSPTPTPTPTPCTQAVIFSGQGQLPASSADYEDFTTSAAGRLDISLDWTFTSSMMAVVVVRAGSCPFDQLQAGTCTFLVQGGGPGTGVPPGTKPLKISTPNFAAGAYNLIILTATTQDESASIQVVLSQGSCAALTSSSESAASSTGERRSGQAISRRVSQALR